MTSITFLMHHASSSGVLLHASFGSGLPVSVLNARVCEGFRSVIYEWPERGERLVCRVWRSCFQIEATEIQSLLILKHQPTFGQSVGSSFCPRLGMYGSVSMKYDDVVSSHTAPFLRISLT